jgi:hypothetical protein
VLGKCILNFSDVRNYNELVSKSLSLQRMFRCFSCKFAFIIFGTSDFLAASGNVNIDFIITSRKEQDDSNRVGPVSQEGNLYIRLIEGKLLKKEGSTLMSFSFSFFFLFDCVNS